MIQRCTLIREYSLMLTLRAIDAAWRGSLETVTIAFDPEHAVIERGIVCHQWRTGDKPKKCR